MTKKILKQYLNEIFEQSGLQAADIEIDDKTKGILDLVSSDKPIDDKKNLHTLADKLGIEHSQLENIAYKMLQSFWASGRAKEKGEFDIDPKELQMGIDVEMEHTTSKIMAERIAKDHLAEIPDYYTRLRKMENEAGIDD